jgi:hypothetical protein
MSISTNPWSSGSPPGSPIQSSAIPTNVYPQQDNPDSPTRLAYRSQSISVTQQSPQSQMVPAYRTSVGSIDAAIAQPVPTQHASLRRTMSLTSSGTAETNPSSYSQLPNPFAAIPTGGLGEDGSQPAAQPQQATVYSLQDAGYRTGPLS